MFGKLLKHEFHATGRIALPLCGMMLALSLLSGMVLRFWGVLQDGWQGMTGQAIIILYGMSLFAVSIGIFVILMQRYKQNFFGSEGYLTRTLPVGEHALLLSKLLTALCWYVVSGLLMALSVLFAGGLTGEFSWSDLRDIMNVASQALTSIWVYTLLATLGGAVFITLLFYAVATIAQNFSKHRLLYYFMVVVIFLALLRLVFGFNDLFYAAVNSIGAIGSTDGGSIGIIGGADGPTAIYVTGGTRWAGLIELYLGNVLLYFLTWGFLTKRPNLE